MQNTRITYTNGTVVEVKTGVMDAAAWERSRDYMADRPVSMGLFMAYNALRRTGQLPKNEQGKALTFVGFCDIIEDIEDDEQEEARPTQQDQPQES